MLTQLDAMVRRMQLTWWFIRTIQTPEIRLSRGESRYPEFRSPRAHGRDPRSGICAGHDISALSAALRARKAWAHDLPEMRRDAP